MFKNKKIVLFLLVLPLVAVLVAPKVALADDDSDWVKGQVKRCAVGQPLRFRTSVG